MTGGHPTNESAGNLQAEMALLAEIQADQHIRMRATGALMGMKLLSQPEECTYAVSQHRIFEGTTEDNPGCYIGRVLFLHEVPLGSTHQEAGKAYQLGVQWVDYETGITSTINRLPFFYNEVVTAAELIDELTADSRFTHLAPTGHYIMETELTDLPSS